jgi:hypothetical protein
MDTTKLFKMAHTFPFRRSPQAARARQSKLMLLPIPTQEANLLSLHAHCALQALVDGCGWLAGVQSLTEVLILTSFVAEAGKGRVSRETWLAAESALNQAFEKGRETGVWQIDAIGSRRVGTVLAMHDAQLSSASMAILATASDRLERLKKGEPEPMPQRKRA